jgi:hypothetical protein
LINNGQVNFWGKPTNGKIKIVDYMKKFVALNINETVINQCRLEVVKYIQKNPQWEFDFDTLEPRLKKLIAFM